MPSLTRIETVVHLQTVELFTYCSAEQMVRMASIAGRRTYAEGERIYSINESADYLFCLVAGRVRLENEQGQRVIEPPGAFGGREILSDHPRAENAVALESCELLVFESEDFFDLLSNNIEIVKALFRLLLRPDRAEGKGPT